MCKGVKRHACRFILSKWQSFKYLNGTIRAISNLQWSNKNTVISKDDGIA